MGTKYIQDVVCPDCGHIEKEVLYQPTSGFVTHTCSNCEHVINLEEVVGVSPEEASRQRQITNLIRSARVNPDVLRAGRDEPDSW